MILTTSIVMLAGVRTMCADEPGLDKISKETKRCTMCHKSTTPGLFQQWKASEHYKENVGCYECHQAKKEDPDAFDHNGQMISIIVSPRDCARCHDLEVTQFESSHHAKAGRILGSLDNRLAEVVEGNKA